MNIIYSSPPKKKHQKQQQCYYKKFQHSGILFLVFLQIALSVVFASRNIGFIFIYDFNEHEAAECHTQYTSCLALSQQYPNRTQDCAGRNNMPVCSQKCFDAPPQSVLPTLTSLLRDDDKLNRLPFLWPPMNAGGWVRDIEYCQRPTNLLYPCLMKKYRWEIENFEPLNNPCQLLHQQNISDIHAIGDSLIRHITAGLVILLNGDYDYTFHNRTCWGDNAFSIYDCRREIYKEYRVCHQSNNKYITIRAIPFSYQWQHLLDIAYPGEGPGNTLYLYGVGLHASNPKKAGAKSYTSQERDTILNASAYIRDKWKGMEEPYFYGQSNYLVWIPPHFKLAIPRTDQTNEKSVQFLQDSAEFFFKQSKAVTLNTFGLTHAAAKYFKIHCSEKNNNGYCQYLESETCQPTRETYDGSHYSRNINLIKAQMLLYQWSRSIDPNRFVNLKNA